MTDDLDALIADRLRRELLEIAVSDPTWDRVVTEATATRPDRRGVLVVAASVATLLVVFLSVSLRPTSPTVVLDDGTGESSWPRPATIDDLLGKVFESTGELPGAPVPPGTLTLLFLPPLSEDNGVTAGGDALLGAGTDPGCNGGTVAIELAGDGTLLAVSSVNSTLMGCSGPPQEMDDWAASLITSQPVFQLLGSDRLQLQAPDGVVVDLIAQPLPDRPSTPPSTSSGERMSCDVAGQQLAAVLANLIAASGPDDIDAGSSSAASIDVDAAVADVSATANCPAEEITEAAANRLHPTLQQQLDADALEAPKPLIDAIVGMLLPAQPPPPEARIPARPTTTVPPSAQNGWAEGR